MVARSNLFQIHQQRMHSEGRPLNREDAVICTLRPKITLVRSKNTLSPEYYEPLADGSMALRNIPVGFSEILGQSFESSGAPLVGLTSLLYWVIGVGRARDSLKQVRDFDKIRDVTSARIAWALFVENISLAAGSAVLTIVRILGAIQELFQLLNNPIVLSSAMMTIQTVAVWVSTFLYLFVYSIFIGRQAAVLKGLSNGNKLRETLLKSEKPVEELRRLFDLAMIEGGVFTEKECREMALQEGEKWLEKLEKEIKNPPWEPNSKSRREHVDIFFRNNPEYMMAEMGIPADFAEANSLERIRLFGSFIGLKRLSAAIENDLKRQLGPEAMDIFSQEKPDAIALKKALSSANWSEWGIRWKTVLKIGLAVGCAAALIAGLFFTGGLALGIPLLVAGVAGLLWIALSDGAAFKQQWESGQVRKWDKFLVYFSVALNVIALGTLIFFTVLSGGAPLYIAGVIFAAAWVIINARAVYVMVDNQKNPWKYQKEVTAQAFSKFLETQRSDDEIEMVYSKMSLENRKGITNELPNFGTMQKAAQEWEQHLKDVRKESLKILKEKLKTASAVVQYLHQNVVAI
jgi:hypothetical protein